MSWQDWAVRAALLLSLAGNALLMGRLRYALGMWRETCELWGKSIQAERDLAEKLQKLLEGLDP